MASTSQAEILSDQVSAEEAQMLEEVESENIAESSPSPARKPDDSDRLTKENFTIVREQADAVRTLISTRENLRSFFDHNLRIYEQGLRPKWLGRALTPPILPGRAALPPEFHQSWASTVTKYENKLQRKLIKYLPNVIDDLQASIPKKREENLQIVLSSIKETRPGQTKRAEVIFYRLCNKTERVPLQNSRGNRPSFSGRHKRDKQH